MPKRTYSTHAEAKRAYDALTDGLQAIKTGQKTLREAANDVNCASKRVIVSPGALHALKAGPVPHLVKKILIYFPHLQTLPIQHILAIKRMNYFNF